jgi:hypothetical protein
MALGHEQISEGDGQRSDFVLPYAPPQAPIQPASQATFTRIALVLALTVTIAAGSILMVGPQIVVIVPLALVAGLVFALRRSCWSLICFGYPLTFGLISAGIGYTEIAGYEQSPAFIISIGIGLVGCTLVAMGLWRTLPCSKGENATISNN